MRLEIDLSLPIYCDGVTIMRTVANQITPLRKWNPAIRPPRYYDHYFCPGKMLIHFLIKSPRQYDHLVNLTKHHLLKPPTRTYNH